jgi:hypothetical protein
VQGYDYDKEKKQMMELRVFKALAGAAAALIVTAGGGIMLNAPRAQAQSPNELALVQQGLAISPVKLNMAGKDPNLVGYGSYLVNAVGSCNDCHTASAQAEYSPGGTPYFNQHPTVVNPAVYMGGGNDFGAFPDPTGNFPHIISRNLTPDATGLPEGGNTYNQFVQIIRTGVDMDHVHPTCVGAPNGNCIPAPFDGDLLQIMPWPILANMTDHDLQAIYTYLSAIPCVEGGPGEPPNRCGGGPTTMAVAAPKNTFVTASSIALDGTASTSADGKPLAYSWTIPQGSPGVAMSGGNTATPTVQFTRTRGTYQFQLTVTDSTGKTSTDTAVINFQGN